MVKSGYTLDSVVSASLGRVCVGEQLVAAERMRQRQGKHNGGQSASQHDDSKGPVVGGGVAEREF